MKKISKILAIILSVIMFISLVPISSSAAIYSGACGDNATWTYDSSTYTLTISGTGAMKDYESNNRPWESYENSIKTVVINNGVTTIGDDAFYDCDSLESVTIPDSVTTIGSYAFRSCNNLTSVTIPDSVTTIGDYAFAYCYSLTSVTVDSNNQYYSSDKYGVLFNKNKTTLIQYTNGNTRTSYTIPDSVTKICDYAFYNCKSLTSVTIPDGVTSIGWGTFYNCDSLTDVYYGGTESQWKNILIDSYNNPLRNATIHYNSTGPCEHSYKSVVTPPTCENQGYTTYTCINCNHSYKSNYTNATGHSFGEWETLTAPTCTTDGNQQRICSICLHTEGKTIAKLNHNYRLTFTVDVEPTCTTDGVKSKHCARCDSRIVITTIPATGHDYEEIVTPPTCTKDGYTTYTCECGDSYIKNMISAKGHEDLNVDAYCDNCDELLCDHDCHRGGITGFFWKITNFFNKIFGSNKDCSCGVAHY